MTKLIIETSKGNSLDLNLFNKQGTIRFYLKDRYMGFRKINRKHIREVESWLREGYKVMFNIK